ncbi:MAG: 3-isopropylmalate dehydratase large subunit [Beijerinckiaceae bacterium]|nr:3-isopropylmalate dehydratase large subunit [Beijerinckiaceae bacterium]
MGETLFDKIWDAHVVGRRIDGRELVYIDRHVLHELHAPHAFKKLKAAGRKVRRPDLTFSALDHTPASKPGRDEFTNPEGKPFIDAMRQGSRENGVRVFDLNDAEHGISHVVAPEIGMVLPGATHAVPDSHACTVGGLGALAFGCGTTELEHVLATQVIALIKPKRMRVNIVGKLGAHASAKDVALNILSQIGSSGGRGHAIEFAGEAARALSVEGRLTLCNLTIEMGSRSGLVAPDDTTFQWLAGRPWAPGGAMWERALTHWRTLRSDDDAFFDKDVTVNCEGLAPQITWGTDPAQVIPVDGRTPDPSSMPADKRALAERALAYMGLAGGEHIEGLPVHRVFIGSCTNARLPDLREAAAILRGRKVAEGVVALVSPGSGKVKREAEAIGLDSIFKDAGFIWGESACSMCAGANGDGGQSGERILSTTNRNFENRQGRGARTHLVGPALAAAAAVSGRIVDVRKLADGQA